MSLEHREMIKKKKPTFTRQDNKKKDRINDKWRKPKGIDSKMRKSLKGYKRCVSQGWRSPKAVRGTDKEGKQFRWINSPAELNDVDAAKESIIIVRAVGAKKKLEILKIAKEKGIVVINKGLEKLEKKFEERKAAKKKVRDERAKKAEKKPKKEKKDLEEKVEGKTEEEVKGEAKKEKDKLLTKKEI